MFQTLLIANRGEIACRVAATARRLGLRTVAVYSDADADAQHVRACDQAVRIGGPEPRDSYLKIDAILAAAHATGAHAIHPGYGFLSENEQFARACEDAGLIFVGPPAQAIAAMGSKSAAKSLMESAGVPLVPGYHGDNQDPNFLLQQADSIGYPVLIKASAGGGGKGMRIVESSDTFLEALRSCQREAAGSFGDDRVLIERYITKPRHIEIQVFGDQHGQYVYLFERDCSVQRRHQKVIEEAPAPGMTPERRQAMGEAAIAAARAVNYVGAGTVEFIAEQDGRFYFMEMNTRLQVEHPVTELITGHDLVEWQLRVADGQPLPARQEQLRIDGHAIEVRIYAENPDNDFLPSIGTLRTLRYPDHAAFAPGPVRIDSGVRQGSVISPFYDPMIAKVITHGTDREQARRRLIRTLADTQVAGVHTNKTFLQRLLGDAAFAQADLDTGLIPRRHAALFPAHDAVPAAVLASAASAVLARQGIGGRGPTAGQPADPWADQTGWRIGNQYHQTLSLVAGEQQYNLRLEHLEQNWRMQLADTVHTLDWHAINTPQRPNTHTVRIWLDGVEHRADVLQDGHQLQVRLDGVDWTLDLFDPLLAAGQSQDEGHGGRLTAPMPGKIIALNVSTGASVKRGDVLLVMEAMKMEHAILAPADGTVTEVFFVVGDQVPEGAELAAMEH
ncbi:MAG TPA: acetyl/propionyl/methylcrotonyl-CoA carboxylase subunit alpha [Alcaligenes sp.]|nr:acetyl/propionyl/methylcrotonyl-CoA carboxylase subunit alpha [Alcaligenes sp.]HRL26584.1 acetyl/propionyl/methylcrotonyl-CoA carboxylase subunit alpha [Alcaligenes sp.]